MKITEIIVNAGRTFNHPTESYANFKPSLSFRAMLEPGEDLEQCAKELQQRGEKMMEDHKQQMLADIRQVEYQARRAASIASTERKIKRLTDTLAELKKEPAQITAQQELELEEDDSCPDCPHDVSTHSSHGCKLCSCTVTGF